MVGVDLDQRRYEIARLVLPYFLKKSENEHGRLVTSGWQDAVDNSIELADYFIERFNRK